jgi:predicted Zn-ribbon and HTH transcriptional regulator
MVCENKTMKKEGEGYNVFILGNKCFRCKHKWVQREKEKPRICPKCKSPYWDKEKTKFKKGEKKNE